MSVDVNCTTCSGKFRVPDTAAGKRIKCPKCKAPITVPSNSYASVGAGGSSANFGSAPMVPMWTLKTEDGAEYGPVSRAELDQWFQEGRITADCQVLQSGAPQWQWATDLYPQLNATSGGPELFAPAGGGFIINTEEARLGASRIGKSSIGKVGKSGRGPRSPVVTYLAYAMYGLGCLQLGMAVLIMVMGAGFGAAGASAASGFDDEAARGAAAASGIMGGMFFAIGVFALLLSIPSFLAGYGLSERKQWGRILTLVLGAISLPNMPVGTAFGICAFVVLLDKKYADEFR